VLVSSRLIQPSFENTTKKIQGLLTEELAVTGGERAEKRKAKKIYRKCLASVRKGGEKRNEITGLESSS
jgi:hypothetical protein